MNHLPNPIPVFYYHSVAPEKDTNWYKSYLTFELRYFQDFLEYLNSRKYEFISLDEYLIRRFDPASKNKKMVCLTFDDGYLDNYVYVFPLLERYNARGTVFISPWYVQDQPVIRPTIKDVWSGKIKPHELLSLGFLSWEEIKLMRNSGIMDFQSHTMTHAKYYSGDTICAFHHPGADYLYPVGNLFPERLPYYITDPEFEKLVPYGTPFFIQTSSVICRRVSINKTFEEECVQILKDYNWDMYQFEDCMREVSGLYESYKSRNKLIVDIECEKEYRRRVTYEIAESKQDLERKLGGPVNHICWPHGDYNEFCHQTAIRAGYRSSHIVIEVGEDNPYPDRFDRVGSGAVSQNRFLSLWKSRYKLGAYKRKFPYNWISKAYTLIKYGK